MPAKKSWNLAQIKLHPDTNALDGMGLGLSASDRIKYAAKIKNVGKKVRFSSKADPKSIGLTGQLGLFKIIGLQYFYDKSVGYRVVCIEYPVGKKFKDDFGRCMSFKEAVFVD